MPIVILSRLSHTGGETIARDAASLLGYELAGDEVLDETARRWNVPAGKIREALSKPPSLFGMPLPARKRFAALLQATVTARLLKDGVVFHGLYGYLMVDGISHAVKVRTSAPLEYRAASRAKEEGRDRKEAEKAISREDGHRAMLVRMIFGADDDDAGLFNLVIDASRTAADEAVRRIAEEARQERYRPNTYSLNCMADLELTCRIRASLVDIDPEVQVNARQGEVRIRTKTSGRSKEKRLQEIRGIVEAHHGVSKVEIEALAHLADLLDKKRLR